MQPGKGKRIVLAAGFAAIAALGIAAFASWEALREGWYPSARVQKNGGIRAAMHPRSLCCAPSTIFSPISPRSRVARSRRLAALGASPYFRTHALRKLKSADPVERVKAAEWLIEQRSERGIRALAGALRSAKETRERNFFGTFLLKAGAPAVPALIECLEDANPQVRTEAVAILGLIGPPARDAVPALRKRIDDPDLAHEGLARKAIAQIEGSGAEEEGTEP